MTRDILVDTPYHCKFSPFKDFLRTFAAHMAVFVALVALELF
jgi:hypothetical protein